MKVLLEASFRNGVLLTFILFAIGIFIIASVIYPFIETEQNESLASENVTIVDSQNPIIGPITNAIVICVEWLNKLFNLIM